jgi:hypothetical protein
VFASQHVRSLKDEVDFVSSFGYAVYLASAEEAEMNTDFQRVYTVSAKTPSPPASLGCRSIGPCSRAASGQPAAATAPSARVEQGSSRLDAAAAWERILAAVGVRAAGPRAVGQCV